MHFNIKIERWNEHLQHSLRNAQQHHTRTSFQIRSSIKTERVSNKQVDANLAPNLVSNSICFLSEHTVCRIHQLSGFACGRTRRDGVKIKRKVFQLSLLETSQAGRWKLLYPACALFWQKFNVRGETIEIQEKEMFGSIILSKKDICPSFA